MKWPSDPVLVVQCAKIVESQWEILVRFASEPVFLHSGRLARGAAWRFSGSVLGDVLFCHLV